MILKMRACGSLRNPNTTGDTQVVYKAKIVRKVFHFLKNKKKQVLIRVEKKIDYVYFILRKKSNSNSLP